MNFNHALLLDETQVQSHVLSLSNDNLRRAWLEHVYQFGGVVIEISDDGVLMNHSELPNTRTAITGCKLMFIRTYIDKYNIRPEVDANSIIHSH